jgi:glycosyltransferase involved in cell wall biosynthesis
VRAQLQLAIVCAVLPDQREDLLKHAARRGIARDRVVFTGYIPDEDLNLLYNTCELFVFPSLYEGFGLPLLEAMTCGACVLAANTSSLPEIAGRDDVLFDPRDPDAFVRAALPLIGSGERRRDLAAFNLQRSREFSWDRCARDAIGAFESAEARQRRRTGISTMTARPRIALFSPLPDRRSGIADYTAALLPHLAEHYQLDLYVDGYAPQLDRIPGTYRVLDAKEFANRADTYATALYHFGNSEFHGYMYDVAQAHPGVVVMHDFFLSGLVHWMDHQGQAPGLFARELVHSHGDAGRQAVDAIARGELMPHDAIYRYPMSRRILASARGTIFHSQYARRLRAEFFPDLEVLPAVVVPHYAQPAPPSPAETAAARAALELSGTDILVCAFGFLAETKQNHLLLEALAHPLLGDNKHLRVAFVGELPRGAYGRRIRALIAASPHARRIEVTGYASEETYRQHLAACDIAVSLRALSRGETSGAVLKNLAAGRATIVSDDAAMGELPVDAVVKVMPDSADALAKALRQLVDTPALRERLGAAALAHVETELRPARIAGAYAVAIDAMLARDSAQSAAGTASALARALADRDAPEGCLDHAAEAMRRHLERHPILARTLPSV